MSHAVRSTHDWEREEVDSPRIAVNRVDKSALHHTATKSADRSDDRVAFIAEERTTRPAVDAFIGTPRVTRVVSPGTSRPFALGRRQR